MKAYAFEKLDVWKKVKAFEVEIYKVTKGFPEEENFGLISQLRRAAVSISSNIAEGSARRTSKAQAQFYSYSYGSTLEILNQLVTSKKLGFLKDEDYIDLREDLESITAMLNKLYQSTRS